MTLVSLLTCGQQDISLNNKSIFFSRKLNNKDLKEVADMIIPYIEKYEPAQWKELSKDTKWHLSL